MRIDQQTAYDIYIVLIIAAIMVMGMILILYPNEIVNFLKRI